MRIYTNYLPLYEEPTENFVGFIKSCTNQTDYYTVQIDRRYQHLKFVLTDIKSDSPSEGIIPLSFLKHPEMKDVNKEDIIFFATKFNIMASLNAGNNRCNLDLTLTENKDMFPTSKKIVAATFVVEDVGLSSITDNLFNSI